MRLAPIRLGAAVLEGLVLGVIFAAGIGYGTLVDTPSSGFSFTGGLTPRAVLGQMLSFGFLGVILYSPIVIAIIAAWLATSRIRVRGLPWVRRAFGALRWYHVPVAYILGLVMGGLLGATGHGMKINF